MTHASALAVTSMTKLSGSTTYTTNKTKGECSYNLRAQRAHFFSVCFLLFFLDARGARKEILPSGGEGEIVPSGAFGGGNHKNGVA